MPKRMACSLTIEAVRDRTKTVTRRHATTWGDLKPGDRLTLIEKGMGLKKGEKQVVLTEVEIVSNRVEPLHLVDEDECDAEGFPEMTPSDFIEMWNESHGLDFATQDDFMRYEVRRIEWRYLDPPLFRDAPIPPIRLMPDSAYWPEGDGTP